MKFQENNVWAEYKTNYKIMPDLSHEVHQLHPIIYDTSYIVNKFQFQDYNKSCWI